MEGDKPILRMPSYSESESEKEDDDRPPSSAKEEGDKMVEDVSILIEWLVENFGYNVAPQGRKNNDETAFPILEIASLRPKKQQSSVLVNATPGKAKVSTLRVGAASPNHKHIKKTKVRVGKKAGRTRTDPNWVSDLKAYLKDLITRFGQQDLAKYTKPVIASLEKKHGVKITDIDGEIFIKYFKTHKEKKKMKSEPKALRYRINKTQLPHLQNS